MEDALTSASTDLDRAPLDTYKATESHHQDGHLSQRLNAHDENSKESSRDTGPKIRAKVRHIATKAKSKLQVGKDDETLIHRDQRINDEPKAAPTLAPPAPPARDADRLFHTLPEKPGGPSLKDVATHPVRTLKAAAGRQGGNAYAENLAKTDVTHGANVNIVRAYDHLVSSKTDEDQTSAVQDLELLKKSRQDSFVRWTMDRHVQKVRKVETIRTPQRPSWEFVERLDDGRYKMHWKDYGQYLLHLYAELYGAQYIGVFDQLSKPTESAIISSFERVILTSAPYQNFLMQMREISLWKQPKRSAGYMATYLLVWCGQVVSNFLQATALQIFKLMDNQLISLLVMVVRRRFYHPTIDELRRDLERSEDTELTAMNISQLIEQHGTHGWVDPLIEKAGPSVLSQLEDLANFLEVLRNFYEWRDPSHTRTTLAILTLLSIIVITTPSRLLVKGTLFAFGFVFFVLAPIWHRYPQYRLLASPLKWIFWKVPTHTEWAIARLQAEATYQLEVMQAASSTAKNDEHSPSDENPSSGPADASPNDSKDPARLIGRYHCTSRNRHGHLTVTTEDVSFKQDLTKDRSWRLSYDQIKAIQKIVGSSTISSGDDLLFIDIDDNEFRTAGLGSRDGVFTQIIGYSKAQWQVTA